MRIIDAHVHCKPRAFFERLCGRTKYPRAERNERGGYRYWRSASALADVDSGRTWFDLDELLDRMDRLGHQVSVIDSMGMFSPHFSDVPVDEGRDDAMAWNEEVAAMQRQYAGRFWGTAAVPLVDTDVALEVLEHAVAELELVGVNVPSIIGEGERIDHERLEPFYDRVEELGVVLLLHPTDRLFKDLLAGYDDALYRGLGRIADVSVTAARLIYSGILERHPDLKVYVSHTGGALPYQAGWLDKGSNSTGVRLPHPVSTYVKRMYTDAVSPHTMGMRFAVEFFGVDHVLYGSDYPCWNPSAALDLFDAIGLPADDRQKILAGNAARLFGIDIDETSSTTLDSSPPAKLQ